ncbi:MAG: hypothetical protein DRN27_08755 [Thermoplasmata archaeon]|nr:MAG: hypothetical protein DRN27_08755 [Thermoplasmata archaeon]
MNYYSFVVDTDSYAGNFEREMTAYVTGVLGDCEVGLDESVLFHDEMDLDLDELMYQKPNEQGTLRPCAIENTGIEIYGGVAIYFYEDPCAYLDMLKERSLEYAKKNNIQIFSFRVQYIEESIKITEIEYESCKDKSWNI